MLIHKSRKAPSKRANIKKYRGRKKSNKKMIMIKNFRMPNIKTTKHKPKKCSKAKRSKKRKNKWINIRKNSRMWTESSAKVVTNNK